MGNAVCRNFLFPLGWPACGLNSTLAGPPTLPAGWVAQLRRRRGAKRQATTVNEREREGRGGVVEGSGDEQEGNGAAHREALASTVRDQMTRASAHNNGLFTLRSDPIPIQAPPQTPLSRYPSPRSRIENQTYGKLMAPVAAGRSSCTFSNFGYFVRGDFSNYALIRFDDDF